MKPKNISPEKIVRAVYTNWKGETEIRKFLPIYIYFGSTEWHPERQWLLNAWDIEKDAEREFALKDFGHGWNPVDYFKQGVIVDEVLPDNMEGVNDLEKAINAYLTKQFILSKGVPADECLSEAQHIIALMKDYLKKG